MDKYRDFIEKKLQANVSISQIRRDLAQEGCRVSHSYLTEWIERLLVGQGVEIPKRKRGRPEKLKLFAFKFLPSEDEQVQESGAIPLFLMALQDMPVDLSRRIRDLALEHHGLPGGVNTHPREWSEVERFAQLSDAELCQIAFLRSELPAPPLTKGRQELTTWYNDLVTHACRLRAEIREACEVRTC